MDRTTRLGSTARIITLQSMVKHAPRALALASGLLFSLAGALVTTSADDTEIFFGQSDEAFENNPNILFMLDTSGSMSNTDEGAVGSRMRRMQSAMNLLLDQSSSFNVGLGAFNGVEGGASIRYPVGWLEGSNEDLCDGGTCPDESVVARPTATEHTAIQDDSDNSVVLTDTTLAMAELADDVGAIPPSTFARTETVVASSSVFEANTPANADYPESAIDQSVTPWFWSGTPGADPGRVAYRFDSVELPPNAEVQSAYITFTRTALEEQIGPMSVRIQAESTSEPLPYTAPAIDADYVSLDDRSTDEKTTLAIASWENIPPVTASTLGISDDPDSDRIQSADLSSILTEVAGLNRWASGNSVSLIVSPTDEYVPSNDTQRNFYGAGALEDRRPVLTYTYVPRVFSSATATARLRATEHADSFEEPSSRVAWTRRDYRVSQLFHVDEDYSPRELALRFDGLQMPQGAEITSARLSMRSAPKTFEHNPADWIRDPDGTALVTDPEDGDPDTIDEPEVGEATGVPIVSMRISAEPTGTPAPYDLSGLGSRDRTINLQPWTDVPDSVFEWEQSPDFSNVLNEVTSRDDWAPGQAISLILAPGTDYQSLPENVRQFYTNGLDAPILDVTWRVPDALAGAGADTQTTAIRFEQVHVPPKATITNARIVFTAAETTDVETNLTISAQKSGAPAAFEAKDNNIGERDPTEAKEDWSPLPWDVLGQEYATVDLSRVVKEIVDLDDWCGGNPMVFTLSGTGTRVAEAFANVTSNVPKLEVTYNPSSVPTTGFCSNSSIDLSIDNGSDDAVQATTGATQHTGVNIGTNSALNGSGVNQEIGLYFPSLPIPPDTRIVSAALRLHSREDITDTSLLGITIDETGSADSFLDTGVLDADRSWSTDKILWNNNGPVDAGEPMLSSDITTLVQSAVSRNDWTLGNSIAFKIDRLGGAHRHFISRDSDEVLSGDLVVYFESERIDTATVFREALKQQVDILTINGATPIVGSLYEAARYLRGESVEFGKQRGQQQRNPSRHYRISHAASYTGGSVSRPRGCTEANPFSRNCQYEEILGNPVYTAPIQNQCQTNHIVLLSDGEATRDTQGVAATDAMIDINCDTSHPNKNEHCGRELSEWLESNDHSDDFPGQQSIEVHTIGLALNNPVAIDFLSELATEKGSYYPATTAAELLNAFKSIFNNVSDNDTSFVSPSLTVSSQNRLKNRDDVYFSVFKPEATARWSGNLKRYKASATADTIATLTDRNDKPAVDPDTGEFKDTARSWWTTGQDGGDIEKGGAAGQLDESGDNNSDRRVFTFTGLADEGSQRLLDAKNRFDISNTRIDKGLFDIPPPLDLDEDYYTSLFAWSRGQDVLDNNGNGDVEETRSQLGDPLHSQPLLLNYADGKSVVFMATNEGFLHAFDTESGEELWAWIPQELLKNLHDLYQNSTTRSRPYGLDGNIATWIDDTDNDGLIDTGERALIYLGMRRGGNSYYALDVSDPEDPEFMWHLAGGVETSDFDPTTADGEYAELGQTWSTPQVTRIIHGHGSYEANIRDVIIFGGGYSTSQDSSPSGDPALEIRSTDAVGRAIFIADALTGEQLWRTDVTDDANMAYSIPSDIAVLDLDFDGIADQLYYGDMGGQVWRADFNNDRNISLSLDARITGGRIAILASEDPGESRRFYYPPSVALINADGRQQLAISIGSGWRAHPLDTEVQDRFYSIRSPHVYGPPVDSSNVISYPIVFDGFPVPGFTNVTDELSPEPADIARGWYIDIGSGVDGAADRPGEKTLSKPLTADGKVIFTTYSPESSAEVCSAALGASSVSVVNVVNGAPTNAFRLEGDDPKLGDRHQDLNQAGLAPGASILFHEDTNKATISVGTETIPVDIGELRRRTFWQEVVNGDTD